MALTTLTLAQWAAARRTPNRVTYINDPTLTDVMYSVAGSPGVLVINLAYFADMVDGKIAGAAIDADSLAAGQIAANAIGSDEILADAVTDAKIASSIAKHPGNLATAVLRISGNSAVADTITIGSDVFELDDITTDSTDTCLNDEWDNSTDPCVIALNSTDYPVIGVGGSDPVQVGDLVYIDSEYLRCSLIEGNNVSFARAKCGSSAAAHANTANIYIATTPHVSNITIGSQAGGGAVNEATFTPLLVGTILDDDGTAGQANDVSVASLASGVTMLLVADEVGVVALATQVTGANKAWDHTAMRYGAAAGVKQIFVAAVVPDSEEATANVVYVPLPFDPTVVLVQVRVTSSGLEGGSSTTEHWDGDMIITAASPPMPAYVEINNDGGSNWDDSDTLYVIAIE